MPALLATSLTRNSPATGFKRAPERAEKSRVPNLMALMIASMIAWMVKDALPSADGIPITSMIAMCVFIVVFPLAKRFLADIRPE